MTLNGGDKMGINTDLLRTTRRNRNLTQDDVARQIGVSRTSYLKYEKGTHEPDFDTLKKITELLGLKLEDLLGEKKAPAKTKIPILGSVQAGMPTEAYEVIEGYEEIDEALASSGTYVALRIKGESMSPKILPGDIVIVKLQSDIDSGEVAVVFVDDAEATVKKVVKHSDGVSLIPYNPSYEPLFFSNQEILSRHVQIYGKVAELRRKF